MEEYRAVMIDDEIWALRGLTGIINWKEYGYDIVGSYTDSVEALEEIIRLKPDIIFTDIRMPEIDGMSLIERLQEHGITSKIVIVTAYKDFEVAKKALQFDVSDYLIKPLDKEEVKNSIVRIHEQLDTRKQKNFDITKIDLLKKDNLSLPAVDSFIHSLNLTKYARILICNENPDSVLEKLSIPATTLFMKKYKFTRLIPDLKVSAELIQALSGNIRFGMNACLYNDNLRELIDEAVISYDGFFVLSANPQTARIEKYLYENYDKKITMDSLCENLYLSKSYVFELFRINTDTSAMNLLKHIKLYKAADMLATTDDSVSSISEKVGFEDPGYFIKVFKAKFGMTPEQYHQSKR